MGLKKLWNRLSLTQQFGLMASIVMLASMAVMGTWVEDQIEKGVTTNASVTTALFLDSFISPLTQELKNSETLSIGPVLALDEVLGKPDILKRVFSVKLWKPDGVVAYSNDLSLVGEKFPLSKGLKTALDGQVYSDFKEKGTNIPLQGVAPGHPVLEIYSPIREPWTGEIIAVMEFYEDATGLAQTIKGARQQSWLMVAATTLVMALVLVGIVHSGTVLIERQRRSLQKALDENSTLLRRIERASGRSAELTERQLRRVSADLHDGPAQLISLAALRIGSLTLKHNDKKTLGEVTAISSALDEAMGDIRAICKGLSLPEIEKQSLSEIIRAVIGSHEAHSATNVALELPDMNIELEPHVKICIYRFVQEGLNNAFRHGAGRGQRVVATLSEDNCLQISVYNDFAAAEQKTELDQNSKTLESSGLGLIGLRERVEALGGDFSFECSQEKGAHLQMSVNLGVRIN
ncbi:hypothetical protein MNBD_ALPHA12-2202 [hydrothermal vent metagenome]|uniref:histidine kinase n=1 Tax=hydrothermal vent metagenome TaxID=652676 RepID=A0A3B0TK90_9ZZZZ